MEKSVILDVFYNIKDDLATTKRSEKNKENDKEINERYAELKKQLSPEAFALHEKLVDALEVDWCQEIEVYFVEAFKLGLRLGIECLKDE